MGVSVGRIEKEFILTSVRDKQISVRVHARKIETDGQIKNFDTAKIDFQNPEGEWAGLQEKDLIRVFFSYYGHTMTFETEVLSVEGDILRTKYPNNLVKNLERKYERVPPPKNVQASFVMKGKKFILDFPRSEEYNPAHKPEVDGDLRDESIQSLISGFREKVGKIASKNYIKMFREERPETLEEKLISRSGKVFFIPNTEGYQFDNDTLGDTKLINRKILREVLLEEGTSEKNVELKIDSLFVEKREQGIRSEIYCPILYREYVAGYVYVANTADKRRPLSEDLLEYVDQFAKILAYSLKMHGYFKGTKPVPTEYSAQIVDISASGMLFAHPSQDLADNLLLYTDFDLVLQFTNRKMTIPSRIMRRFEEADTFYYGTLFLEMQPEDFRYLFDFIYGREYRPEDEDTWEGGASPPAINLFGDVDEQ